MMKTVLASAAVLAIVAATPAMADMGQQNASLNSYVGHATEAQANQPTAFQSAHDGVVIHRNAPVGSGNASLESFNPNSAQSQPTRFEAAPGVAENSDFRWVEDSDIGA
ncbi:hypothetical protein [Aquibaculum arenosum]|uniref:Uncharacterized protein n=1 Tax=Aquibaculum arenosum TaxID=3032591 RepID=A0ABT5YKQ8_9PROT|nr:hypothetical protein [Fodinicurvata sp. CAU 1616]MDF2095457.1 hypothetical protein [Fodinicurvata sp. CAU 1616]